MGNNELMLILLTDNGRSVSASWVELLLSVGSVCTVREMALACPCCGIRNLEKETIFSSFLKPTVVVIPSSLIALLVLRHVDPLQGHCLITEIPKNKVTASNTNSVLLQHSLCTFTPPPHPPNTTSRRLASGEQKTSTWAFN